MMPAFIIWSLCAAALLVIGIIDLRSEKPVGFFAGVKPPKVRDVKKYNRAVARIWIIGAVIFELLGLPFLFLKQNAAGFIIIEIGTVFWAIGLMIAYVLISGKYVERK